MTDNKKEFIKKYGIVFILIFFTAITSVGIFYNYPLSSTVADETVLMSAALKMIAEPSLRPDYPTMYHMPLGAYLYVPFFAALLIFLRLSGLFTSTEALKEFGILHYGKLLPMARLISLFLGAASVYLVYRICEKLFNNRFISLAASFLLATNLVFVELAHFGRVWLPQIFVILLTFYFIVIFYEKEQAALKDYCRIALLTAASFGTHVIGVLIYLSFVTAHYIKNKSKKLKEIFLTDKNFWLANFIIVVSLPLIYYLNPHGFINYTGQSIKAGAAVVGNATGIDGGIDFWTSFSDYGKVLFETGPALTIVFIFSLIPFFFFKRNLFFILGSFILGYYVVIGPIVGSNSIKEHYIVPVIPFMAIISAYGMYYFYQSNFFGKNNLISYIIKFTTLGAVFLSPVYPVMLWDYWAIQPSTQVSAQEWIYNNLPQGARIVVFDNALPVNENRESLEDTQSYAQNSLTKRQAYLLSIEDSRYPKPDYYVLRPADYRSGIPQEILNKGFDYVVLTWWYPKQYESALEDARQFGLKEKNPVKIFPSGADQNTFSVDLEIWRHPLYNLEKMNHLGPVIAVYSLKK